MSKLNMTSRERILTTLAHKEPDRVAITFGGSAVTGILESAPDAKGCTKLYEYMGLEDYEAPIIGDCWNMVQNIDERVKVKFGTDMRYIGPNIPAARIEPDGTKVWEAFCGMRVKRFGIYDDPADFPMANWTSKKDIDNYPYWPTPDTVPVAEGKREEAKNLRENADYAVVGDGFYCLFPFNGYAFCSGMAKWLLDMKLRPDFYIALADKFLEVALAMNDKFFSAIGDYIDIAVIYDDLGTQEGLFYSHPDYVKFIKPYTKELIKGIKKHTTAKIMIHSCGSVYDAIPDLIEIGVDILNPVQPLARNMEPWRLKKEFGNDICFCGGVDLQHLLPKGTVEEVKQGVRDLIRVYAPGGGYIFGPAHNIPPDVPPQNIVAAFMEAQEFGIYPIK
ncbi:MAG: uroporphyrinogen decarboxylase family protein [Candidatus Humimicrobiaceae bacterium]